VRSASPGSLNGATCAVAEVPSATAALFCASAFATAWLCAEVACFVAASPCFHNAMASSACDCAQLSVPA
jgi:hypothetical protein